MSPVLLKSHGTFAPFSKAADALDSPQSLPNKARYGLILFVGRLRKDGMLQGVAEQPLGRDVRQRAPSEKAAGLMRITQKDGRGMHAL
jgi:hypothetical protein